ncbi:S-adenosyl-L-methionine-dependent methyltransferase [Russula earlei]|uniref:S-adenosyl-L-methionine-dependent methyltransferase n=1 Tax=Russula earlei TaxID=71964 RepID=A0ACC0TWG5_9AGAM|nr:S-adenosyl-L-methionine-dependent methyltransferase [Russula earlei]
MTFATLRALQAIIGDAIDEIYLAYASENSPSPSPSPSVSSSPSPKQHRSPTPPLLSLSNHTLSLLRQITLNPNPSSPAEQLTFRPDVANAISRIVAAASQMAVVVRSPFLTICDATMIYHLPSCLQFFEASHIPELLSAAGPAGLSVVEISASVGVDSVKTSHVLRLLATHHIVRECEPDIFALNRISALLDSGRPFTECKTAPEKKYDAECGGVAALAALNTDELFKASAYFTDALLPSLDTTFNLSHRTTLPYWTWLETPENSYRLARFARAMAGTEGWMGASDAELCAFPFPDLAEGALVVDVGGGIGSMTLRLAERFPKLRFVVQDREPVCRLGEDAWHIHSPALIKSGRVRFQVHDFFKPQPTYDGDIKPAVFLLRVVCHDWPDALARRILLQLRRAADEGTTDKKPTYLVIGDHLLPYACTAAKVSESRVEEGMEALRGARWPLLTNLGAASANAYWMDMTMQVTLGGQERTLPELRSLAESAGWRLIRVARTEVAEPGPLPSGSVLGTPFPSAATITAEDEIPPSIRERGATPVMDMLGAARTLLRARAGGKKAGPGESVWVRWMPRKIHADENDARRTLITSNVEKSIATPSQGRGLLKKVSQYFVEGS